MPAVSSDRAPTSSAPVLLAVTGLAMIVVLFASACSISTDSFDGASSPVTTIDDSPLDSARDGESASDDDRTGPAQGGQTTDDPTTDEQAQNVPDRGSSTNEATSAGLDEQDEADSVALPPSDGAGEGRSQNDAALPDSRVAEADEPMPDDLAFSDPDSDGASDDPTPSDYGSATLDDNTPTESGPATPTPAGADSTDEGALTGSVSESDLELLAARGAILTEAFGLPGARLMTDSDRRCVLAEFETTNGGSRTNEIIASTIAIPGEVDSLVSALLACGVLPSVADGLIGEIEPLLDDRLSPAVVACIAGAYSQPESLAAAMRLAVQSDTSTPEEVRAVASVPVVDCVGLGDLLAADFAGVSNDTTTCLNQVGSHMIAELLDVEIRSSKASIDAVQVGLLIEACVPPSEIGLTADE